MRQYYKIIHFVYIEETSIDVTIRSISFIKKKGLSLIPAEFSTIITCSIVKCTSNKLML